MYLNSFYLLYTLQVHLLASVMFLTPDPLPVDHLAGNNEVRLLYIIIRFPVVYGMSILALTLTPA